jgi:hypothetical protein
LGQELRYPCPYFPFLHGLDGQGTYPVWFLGLRVLIPGSLFSVGESYRVLGREARGYLARHSHRLDLANVFILLFPRRPAVIAGMLLALAGVSLAKDTPASDALRPPDALNQAAFEHYYDLEYDAAIRDLERIWR